MNDSVLYLFICVCVLEVVNERFPPCVERAGDRLWKLILSPLCCFYRSNSSRPTWQPAALPSEPPCRSLPFEFTATCSVRYWREQSLPTKDIFWFTGRCHHFLLTVDSARSTQGLHQSRPKQVFVFFQICLS